MTVNNNSFFFYSLLPKNVPWLDRNFKYGGEKLKKNHVTVTHVGHFVTDRIFVSHARGTMTALL